MRRYEMHLPASIYDPAATRKLLGEGIEAAIIEGGRYLWIRLPHSSDADAAVYGRLPEQLNQVLRASIVARLPALRAEDE
jgi:hypothetical protein